jgi:hypothetical protein
MGSVGKAMNESSPSPPPPFTPPPDPTAPVAPETPRPTITTASATPPAKSRPTAWIIGGCGCLTLLFIIAAVVIVAFTSRNRHTKRSSDAPPADLLAEQAMTQARSHFDSVWLKRGDSWFTVENQVPLWGEKLVEAKDISFKAVDRLPLAQADKLNGVEWSGRIAINATVSRSRAIRKASDWSAWQSGFPILVSPYELTKKNGKWEMTPSFGSCRRPSSAELGP